jgi:hypothetical protein
MGGKINTSYSASKKWIVTKNFSDHTNSSNSLPGKDKFWTEVMNKLLDW